nr:hypothetical protein [Tanacetum cinerariifolium]
MTSLEDINDPTKAMNSALVLFAKAFQLSAPTNNNQRTSSNPHNRQLAQPVMNIGQDRQIQNVRGNGGNKFGQYNAGVQSGGNQNGLVVVSGIANQSGTGNVVAARAEGTEIGNQARCYNCRGLCHIARNCTARPRRKDAAYLHTHYSLLKRKKQGSNFKLKNLTSWLLHPHGTQHDKAPVYDTDGSAENDNHVTSVAPSMVQSGGTVETSSAPNEEIRAHQETVYRNLVDQVAQVDMVNRNMRATNAELKS